ncbi:hypothetical protein [Azospirillum sp. TSO5]|uniref:hypothetical protein n=1 Tax=Azospirillum sp. TSO5 TaxID=716760 RepID=UPI0011B1ECD8|nr:hypothetical protein [Azospirillum sp. TSO5]
MIRGDDDDQAKSVPIWLPFWRLEQLRESADRQMWRAWNNIYPAGGRVYEVQCIRSLIDHAVPAINNRWQSIFGRIGVTADLVGVVCHNYPRVTYIGAPHACELGDLMIVHDHLPDPVNQPDHIERHAVIVQAKVFHRNGVQSTNLAQFLLYTGWPCFTYVDWPGGIPALERLLNANAGIPLGTPEAFNRDIRVDGPSGLRVPRSTVDLGARYGMIDVARRHWIWWQRVWWFAKNVTSNPWRMCRATSRNLYDNTGGLSLGHYLARLVTGRVGRAVRYPGWPSGLGGADHWSLLVEELLSLLPAAAAGSSPGSSAAAAAPATSASPAAPSGSGGTLSLVLDRQPSGTGGNPTGRGDGDDDGGFAIIMLRTTGGPRWTRLHRWLRFLPTPPWLD